MEDSMIPMKNSGKVSKTLDSVIRENLAKFAATCNFTPNQALAGIWVDCFKGIQPEMMEAAMCRVGKTFSPTSACPFPVPAHVWEVLNSVKGNEKKISADSAWETALHWARHHWHPDVAYSNRPELERKVYRALGSAGGPQYLFGCTDEQTQWAKKRFIEAYEQLDTLEQDEFFLTDGEAKRVLQSLGPKEIIKKLTESKKM